MVAARGIAVKNSSAAQRDIALLTGHQELQTRSVMTLSAWIFFFFNLCRFFLFVFFKTFIKRRKVEVVGRASR